MEIPRTRMSINGMIWDRVPKGVFDSGDILDLESVMPWHIFNIACQPALNVLTNMDNDP